MEIRKYHAKRASLLDDFTSLVVSNVPKKLASIYLYRLVGALGLECGVPKLPRADSSAVSRAIRSGITSFCTLLVE